MTSLTVYLADILDDSVETLSEQQRNDRLGLCTPPPTLETFSKKSARNSFQYRDSGFSY